MLLPEDVTIAICRRETPEDLAQHLRMASHVYGVDYQMVADIVDPYWRARDVTEAVAGAGTGAVPMDVDQV